jgi:hypothetical protein
VQGSAEGGFEHLEMLRRIPDTIALMLQDRALDRLSKILADQHGNSEASIVIGGRPYYGIATEIALKLEESSWTAMGKTFDYHDLTDEVPLSQFSRSLIIVMATDLKRMPEALSIMKRFRDADIQFVTVSVPNRFQTDIERYSRNQVVFLPRLDERLQLYMDLIFFYRFAFYFGIANGRTSGVPPRNRAKSLTVIRSPSRKRRKAVDQLLELKNQNIHQATQNVPVAEFDRTSIWESKIANGKARRYLEEMRGLAKHLAHPKEEGLLWKTSGKAVTQLNELLFDDASVVEELVFIPLDRTAEAAIGNFIQRWRLLLDLQIRLLSPWEDIGVSTEEILPIYVSAEKPKREMGGLFDGQQPFTFFYIGPDPGEEGIRSNLLEQAGGCFFTESGDDLPNSDALYTILNQLFIESWSTVVPQKAELVSRNFSAAGRIITEMLNSERLLADIEQAVDDNHVYRTALMIGPPAGIGLTWTERFDRIGAMVTEYHIYGQSAHGPLVTVDPKVADKFVLLEERQRMIDRYGKERVIEWEKICLKGQKTTKFLKNPMRSKSSIRHAPFFAEEKWFLPVLRPGYDTRNDNLIIIDAAGEQHLTRAIDELFTFGCRYPRMIIITQEAFLPVLDAAAVFKFPVGNLIVIPNAEGADGKAPVSDYHLPFVMNLIAEAMAALLYEKYVDKKAIK